MQIIRICIVLFRQVWLTRWRDMRAQITYFKPFILNISRRKMNSRKCESCKTDVHRLSYTKHLRNRKHFKNIKQDGMSLLKIGLEKYITPNH